MSLCFARSKGTPRSASESVNRAHEQCCGKQPSVRKAELWQAAINGTLNGIILARIRTLNGQIQILVLHTCFYLLVSGNIVLLLRFALDQLCLVRRKLLHADRQTREKSHEARTLSLLCPYLLVPCIPASITLFVVQATLTR